jgi:hypothetical protein
VNFTNFLKLSCCTLFTMTVVAACTTGEENHAPGPPPVGDPNPEGKPSGQACTNGNECPSGVCFGGSCQEATSSDGVRDGDETDVDCGGSSPNKCENGKGCVDGDDCKSRICDATKKCADASDNDNIKNGGETDVDCGGPAPTKRCAAGKACLDHSDCESNGCTYDKKCAVGASCTQLEGGQTCGPNEAMTQQADCCTRAQVGPYTVDKYLITAGRMRAFLARLNGKVRDWAATLPADKWNQAWTPMLPNSIDGTPGEDDNASTQLGPFWGKRSCETGYHTGHTFWTPSTYGDTKDFSKEVLDTKALNCVPWWLMAALCTFDGGHLLKQVELRAAYTNNGTTAYPWGARGTYTTTAQNGYAIGLWSYETPNPPPGAGVDGDGYKDAAFYVAPPGRRPNGYNASGHADLVGNLLEWVGDTERQFVWKGSFENHAQEADAIAAPVDNNPYLANDPRPGRGNRVWTWPDVVAPAPDAENVNGYYGIGGRCGY